MTVTLEALAELLQQSLEDGRRHHVELLELRRLHIAQHETLKRMETRLYEVDRHVGELLKRTADPPKTTR